MASFQCKVAVLFSVQELPRKVYSCRARRGGTDRLPVRIPAPCSRHVFDGLWGSWGRCHEASGPRVFLNPAQSQNTVRRVVPCHRLCPRLSWTGSQGAAEGGEGESVSSGGRGGGGVAFLLFADDVVLLAPIGPRPSRCHAATRRGWRGRQERQCVRVLDWAQRWERVTAPIEGGGAGISGPGWGYLIWNPQSPARAGKCEERDTVEDNGSMDGKGPEDVFSKTLFFSAWTEHHVKVIVYPFQFIFKYFLFLYIKK